MSILVNVRDGQSRDPTMEIEKAVMAVRKNNPSDESGLLGGRVDHLQKDRFRPLIFEHLHRFAIVEEITFRRGQDLTARGVPKPLLQSVSSGGKDANREESDTHAGNQEKREPEAPSTGIHGYRLAGIREFRNI